MTEVGGVSHRKGSAQGSWCARVITGWGVLFLVWAALLGSPSLSCSFFPRVRAP